MKGINNDTVSCQSNIAALYLRLSKEDMHKNAKEDSESIKNQRLLLIEEALKRGFVVADIYCDEDFVLPYNRIVAFRDFVGKKTSPYDDNGHGTQVPYQKSENILSKISSEQ